MTQRQFWMSTALLYAIGLAAAFFLVSTAQRMPTDARALFALLSVPLVWGIGPIALALIWLAVKRDLSAARFGLFVFAVLYLVIVGLNLWWHDLV
jgi:hypothetical protein